MRDLILLDTYMRDPSLLVRDPILLGTYTRDPIIFDTFLRDPLLLGTRCLYERSY